MLAARMAFPKTGSRATAGRRIRNGRVEIYPPVFDFRVLGLGTQEDDQIWMLLDTKKSRPDCSAESLIVHFTSSAFSRASLYVPKFFATGFSVG